MARILIVGGGCRGLRLAAALRDTRHVVRIATRHEWRRAEIEAVGAECFIGDPGRLVTLGAALEHVAVACWLLAGASGDPGAVRALHGSRLEQFLGSAIDTTIRGIVYEAGGRTLPRELLAAGERIFRDAATRGAIPARVLRADPDDVDPWLAEAQAAIGSLLAGALS